MPCTELRKKILLCHLTVGLVVTLSASQAMASADYFDLSPEQLLNATVISATKTRETVEQSPAAVYVITNEDIVRSGATSIADALRMAPGVDVAQQGTGSWDINIRGFNRGLMNGKEAVDMANKNSYDLILWTA